MKTIEQAIKDLEADNVSGLSYLGSEETDENVDRVNDDGFQFHDVRDETIPAAARTIGSVTPQATLTTNDAQSVFPESLNVVYQPDEVQSKLEQHPAQRQPVQKKAPDNQHRSVFPTITPGAETSSKSARPVKSLRTPQAVSSRLTTNKTMRRPAVSNSAPAQTNRPAIHYREQEPTVQHHIPFKTLKERGMISPDEPTSLIAQQFRAIKRPLVRNLANAPLGVNTSVILVTSSSSGEGKSFTAVNLAMSLAMEREKNVLLVDTDSTKASTSTLLGVEDPHVGLMDSLVRDDLKVSQVLRTTNVPNLTLLPVGRAHGHATELLASDRMRRTINELSDGFDDRILVIDSSPLLQTEEAGVLADIAGQIVFVVAAEQTAYATALDAVARLPRTDNVSLVLNKARKATSTPYGYGGYGYGAAVSPDGLRN